MEKIGSLVQEGKVKAIGRCQEGENLYVFWTGSGIAFTTDATDVSVTVDAHYENLEIWVDILIDGELSQRRMLDPGENRICILRHMELRKKREIRIIRSSQAMSDDTVSYLSFEMLACNGTIEKPQDKPLLLEFIGDSITSGEGAGLEKQEDWVPAVFSACNTYAYLTAQRLNAEYSILSQSGWGLYASWDGDYTKVLPAYYRQVAGLCKGHANEQAGAGLAWDFSRREPEAIVVNLGTNDDGAMTNVASDQVAFLEGFVKAGVAFLKTLRDCNPHAELIWAYGMMGVGVLSGIEKAIELYQAETGDDKVSFFQMPACQGKDLGARMHPTLSGHEKAAEALSAYIKRRLEK